MKSKKELIKNYTDESMNSVDPLKHIYLKPAMYLSTIEHPGHTIEEAIANSIDEFVIGVADYIKISIYKDNSISIFDNGRGIPPFYSEKFKMPTVRASLIKPNTGKAFAGNTSGTSQHGIGMKATVATSEYLDVKVYRDFVEYHDRYECKNKVPGIPVIKLDSTGNLPKKKSKINHGTLIHWLPNKDVWDSIRIKTNQLKERCQELAFLNKGLTIELYLEKDDETFIYKEDSGCVGLLEKQLEINNIKKITPIYTIDGSIEIDKKEYKCELYFCWTSDTTTRSMLYTNFVNNNLGGTPIDAFSNEIVKLLNKYNNDLKISKDYLKKADLISGLVLLANLNIPNPNFIGQDKKKLSGEKPAELVKHIISTKAPVVFDRSIDSVKTILTQANKRAIERAKLEENNVDLKSKDVIQKLSEKLEPARKKGEKAELFIVEGDSAAGTVINERDTNYQAVLPLKGKVVNTYKMSTKKALSNTELLSFFTALGTGILDDFDIKKLNYHYIIITVDQDPDGDDISCLLLTAILKFTPDLIKEGKVYRVLTPLFINYFKDNTKKYCYSEKEQELFLKKNKKKIISIVRNKGLGKLSPELVDETIINKDTRKLLQFNIPDGDYSYEETVEILMGRDTEQRKEIFFESSLYELGVDL